ncbi:uncharacterized protein HD556DRAFT_1447282 [Suillus plorans]|uniref:Uncharacterized protein n=1 Tax=Suillus plorans TaxID=116603 RepID=A0A9P7AI73_9AGAM|nr:uncharacterized protein HD556DRAFT_1447282 [Suillus plorans]KAG1789007.1 hypothetical protein HD556DRAFT_1447282 [Suillus plorans]
MVLNPDHEETLPHGQKRSRMPQHAQLDSKACFALRTDRRGMTHSYLPTERSIGLCTRTTNFLCVTIPITQSKPHLKESRRYLKWNPRTSHSREDPRLSSSEPAIRLGNPPRESSTYPSDTRYVADISRRAGPSTISRYHKQHHVDSYNYSFHPYRWAPSFQDRRAFECMLGSSDSDNSLEDMKGKTDDGFLKHMDVLGPQSFRLIVHYKEAVRERQRLDLFVAYWAREESKRLDNLRQFMLQAAQEDFARAEREASVLMRRLLEKHPPSTDIDAQSLATLSDQNKKHLRKTDTQLDLLKDRIVQRQMASSRDDDSNNNLDAA